MAYPIFNPPQQPTYQTKTVRRTRDDRKVFANGGIHVIKKAGDPTELTLDLEWSLLKTKDKDDIVNFLLDNVRFIYVIPNSDGKRMAFLSPQEITEQEKPLGYWSVRCSIKQCFDAEI